MLIVCPSCASEYMIDPGRLGAEGRMVRCAGCKTTWFVISEPEEPAAPEGVVDTAFASDDGEAGSWDAAFAAAADADGAADGDQARSRAPSAFVKARGKAQLGGLARRVGDAATPLMAVAGIIILVSALWSRAQIVRTFPATAALYAGIGLPVNLRGLEFRTVRSEVVGAGSDAVLVVEGEIANISGRDAPLPPIEIGVRGPEGQMLYTWTNDPPRETLATSDTAQFRARLAAPPAEGRQVLVRFAAGREGAILAAQTR